MVENGRKDLGNCGHAQVLFPVSVGNMILWRTIRWYPREREDKPTTALVSGALCSVVRFSGT